MASGGTSRAPWRAVVALVAFAVVAGGVGAGASVEPAVSLTQPEDSPVASGDDKKPEPLPDEAPEADGAPEAEEAPVADEDPCGRTFTYWDGDAQRTVTLCDEIPGDGGGDLDDWRGGRGASSAGCASAAPDANELLFRAESGVEMALGHSVVLVLDPGWSDRDVRRFLARNRIPFGCASPLGWIDNGFTIATGPGIRALVLANSLAGQSGVVLSSPNWASEFELKSVATEETAQVSAPSIVLHPSDRSLTVVWTPPSDLPDGAAVTYDIAWIASDDADEADAEWNTISGVAATPTHRLLQSSEFANNVSYDVKVRAVTDDVVGDWSAVASATTFERSGSSGISRSRPAIPYGVRIGGYLDSAGPDRFNFALTERTGVLIRTGGSIRDSKCRLYHDSGDPVHSGDSGYGYGAPCSIYAVLNAGAYYLTVTAYNMAGSRLNQGSIFVTAETVTPTGRSRDAALPVAVGEEAFGYMGLDQDGADFWRIDVAAREFIDIHIETFHPDDDDNVEASLLDSTGAQQEALIGPLHEFCLVSSCNYSDKRVRAELAAGTYYIKVGPTGRHGASYSLKRHIEHEYRRLVTQCEAIARGEGVNDPLAGCQWHLDNRGQRGARAGEDANVADAHAAGYLGAGVHVAVVDTGIDLAHADLSANTASSRSRAYCGDDTASFRSGSDHGTAVAGLVAARDNAIGMRGVAPRATLHNRRLLCGAGLLSAADVADAMTRSIAGICVNTNSWGWSEGPWAKPVSSLFDLAVASGLATGCGGKGTSYVWAAGNGHRWGDDANLSELTNHYGVMAVCAVNARGRSSSYSEEGTNLWVCGPSDDRGTAVPKVATTANHSRYRTNFGGTSAAAPIVAGVAALVRAANGELTWRDVKLILAASARRNDSGYSGWTQGAAKYGEDADGGERYWYSRRYGFGVVDAHAAVELAKEWTNLPVMITQTQTFGGSAFQIPNAPASISKTVTFDDAIGFVEFVQIDTSFQTPRLRDLKIELISPSGTTAVVLPELSNFYTNNTELNEPFRFGVAQFLGEPAQGTWTLRISGKSSGNQASLASWGITLYGHRPATNVDPVFAAEAVSVEVAEDVAVGAAVGGPVVAVDGDDDAVLAYTLSGADAAGFSIDGATGQISVSSALDYEAPADGDGDNAYELTVSVSDGRGAGGVVDASVDDSVAVTVDVADVDEPLVLAAGDCDFEVVDQDSGDWVCGFAASDPEGEAVAWSLSGDDAALFEIDAGVLSLVEAASGDALGDADGDGVYEVTVEAAAGGHTASADVSLTVVAQNRAPVFVSTAPRASNMPPGTINAVPGILVSLPLAKADFSDPDGDELTFEMTASRDDIYVSGGGLVDDDRIEDGLIYSDRIGRVFFLAKTTCALAELDPAPGEVYETVVTMTATDPEGESAQASVVFRTDPVLTWSSQPLRGGPCPSFSSAAVDGDTLVVSLDGAVAPSFNRPTGSQFAVTVDGVAVGVTGVARLAHGDTTITLTLASPVAFGQAVTVGYATGHSAVAKAFTDQTVTNNTPKPPTPVCVAAPEGATVPICAAVSGKDLIVTFSGDLAAIDGATADALRFAIFVDGAFHNGAPVNSQSAGRITVSGATLTLTLGTAVRAGDEVTVRYFASAAGNALKASDGTPLPDFTVTVTTTAQS